MRRLGLLALPLLLAGCATAAPEPDLLDSMFGVGPVESARIAARIADKPLGGEANPVRADMPTGQRAYLSRLRCSDLDTGRGTRKTSGRRWPTFVHTTDASRHLGFRQRQPHDAGIASGYPRHESARAPLDGVGTGLAERLARLDIAADVGGTPFVDLDQ